MTAPLGYKRADRPIFARYSGCRGVFAWVFLLGNLTLTRGFLTGNWKLETIKMIRVEHFEDSTDLARGIQAGDADVYAAFFNRLYAPVLERARYLLKNHEDAEDATQEVFFKAWEKRSKYDPAGGDFVGWFLVLAERTLLDAYRKRKRLSEIEVTSFETPFEEDSEILTLSEIIAAPRTDVLDAIVVDETLAAIEAALLEMTPVYRLTFILYYFEGYSLVEVSEIMRCPYSTSKIRAYRARHQILAILEEVVSSGFQKK
ncbi:hypothetical protein C6499_22910 [Candidatus Poribacteria bacterium]|nr:MAG: hypothetical protein C6499_22910 [Candidatus Poribacteria bacterium]